MTRAVITLACLATLLVACGGGDSKEPQAQDDPAALLQRSAAAVTDAGYFHFKLTQQHAGIPLPLNLELSSAEGDFQVPGRLTADVRGKGPGGINISTKIIAIDDRAWYTNLFTRDWSRVPGAGLSDLADLSALVTSLLPKVINPRLGDETELDGVTTTRVEGSIDSGELIDALPFAQSGASIKVEAWIGIEDSLPRRIRLTGPLTPDEDANAQRQLDLSHFGVTVQINPP